MKMKPPKGQSQVKTEILSRTKFLYALFVLSVLLILLRLLWVQFGSRETAINADRLKTKIFTVDTLEAHRGTIFSRNDEPLAISIFRYTVCFDFGSEGFDNTERFHEESDSLSKLLARYFKDKPASEYRRIMRERRRANYSIRYRKDTIIPYSTNAIGRFFGRLFGKSDTTEKLYDTLRRHTNLPLFRDIDYHEWQTLKEYPLLNGSLGMTCRLEKHDERVFPSGNLALRTIGRSNQQGHYGIEHAYSEQLAGKNGVELRQRIAPGFRGKVTSSINQEPEDGLDIVTTIDIDVQDVADKALREQMLNENGIWGTSLVMECKTGDILAIANLGRNAAGEYVENKNYALGSRCEPGSTFKLTSLLALLEDKGLPLSTTYDTGSGRVVLVGPTHVKVQDSHNIGAEIDMKTAVAQSANVYFTKAIYEAYCDNPKRYIDFLRTNLHLGERMGLEKLGEVRPAMREPGTRSWDKHTSLVNMGYGYAIELAPIHTLTLYNAVANEGRMVAPRLIRELRHGGSTYQRMPTEILVNRVCSPATLSKVYECLEEVAISGSAKGYFGRDKVPFRVCAKTGTAKFAQGDIHYSDGYYLGSMVTFFPAEKPRYTIMTAIFKRRGTGTSVYGNAVAGPVQKKIATFLYNRETDWGGADNDTLRRDTPKGPLHVKGGNIEQIRRAVGRYSPHVQYSERKGWGRTEVDEGRNVIINTLPDSRTTLPDVTGMGLKDAMFLLESCGVRVAFSGSGRVVSQSPAAGTPAANAGSVSIVLR